jgi:hypothetical protein
MYTVTTGRFLMALGLLVGLVGLIFFQYASAQYYTKDESEKPSAGVAMGDNLEKQDSGMAMSEEPTSKGMEMKNTAPSPPLMQIAQGIAPADIQCREGLQLVFKTSNDMPACVKPSSAQRLIEIGWAKPADAMNGTMPAKVINKIDLSATEEDEVYRWSDSGGINPTLTILANTENQIQIQNPTDTKHEFVIESDGEEIVASGDIEADSSGKLTITPDTIGTWQYHCEYHPTTMNGTINIVAP